MNYYDQLVPIINSFIVRNCTPSWTIEKAVSKYYDLTYVQSGKLFYTVNGVNYSLKAGEMIYIPKGSSKKACTDPQDPMFGYTFHFHYQYLNNEHIELNLPTVLYLGEDMEIQDLYEDFHTLWLMKQPGYMLKARAVFMLILYRVFLNAAGTKTHFSENHRIEKIKEYIIHHYHQKIYIKQLANLLNMNSDYFGSFFKKNTGYCVNEYVNRIRVNRAHDLLVTGEYSVGEVAYICGFEDIFYFSKVYKKIMGVPPSVVKENT